MAAMLPISRVVDVTVTREDRFPDIQGFGIVLIVTSQAKAQIVDAANRTKLYGSMSEVAEDWDAVDEAYKAAQAIFSQNPRPRQLKIGYAELDGEGEPDIADELDAIEAADPNWYRLVLTEEFRGTRDGTLSGDDIEDAIIAWIETRNKQAHLDTNDPELENPQDTTNVAARNKGGAFDRTSIFYHTDEATYLAAAAAGYMARRNFDEPNSAYTANFKRLRTISAINKGSAAVQAITGFVPQEGLQAAQGHLANTYVNIGGLEMLKEGNTLSGAFLDEIHAQDWLIARMQESVLATLANNDRVPMTNTGVHTLVSAVESVMQRAFVAGLIADVEDEETGDLLPAYEFEVERVEDIPASQRRNRIAPTIIVTFRYSGAIHFVTVRAFLTF